MNSYLIKWLTTRRESNFFFFWICIKYSCSKKCWKKKNTTHQQHVNKNVLFIITIYNSTSVQQMTLNEWSIFQLNSRVLTLAKTPGSASITAVRHFIAFVLTATAFSDSTFKIWRVKNQINGSKSKRPNDKYFGKITIHIHPVKRILVLLFLKELDTLNFSSLFTKETTFVTLCLLSCTPSPFWIFFFDVGLTALSTIFCLFEVLRPSQPNGVMSSSVSLTNHTFTGRLSPLSG